MNKSRFSLNCSRRRGWCVSVAAWQLVFVAQRRWSNGLALPKWHSAWLSCNLCHFPRPLIYAFTHPVHYMPVCAKPRHRRGNVMKHLLKVSHSPVDPPLLCRLLHCYILPQDFSRWCSCICVCMCQILTKEEYACWLQRHLEAETSIQGREQLLFESALRLETNLQLLGNSHPGFHSILLVSRTVPILI